MRRKIKRNAQIVLMAQEYNAQEMANHFGISRERVRQILATHGVKANHKSHAARIVMDNLLKELGTMSDTELGKKHGLSSSYVSYIRQHRGIAVYKKPIGCENCRKEHYARGLCRACYCRSKRRTEHR